MGGGRPSKKSRENTPLTTVMTTLAASEALSTDMRALFKSVLPIVLSANKVDRHAYEVEVVQAAEQALTAAQKALGQAQKAAMAEQTKMIGPGERTNREAAKKQADENATTTKSKLEAAGAAKKVAEKDVSDAEGVAKAAQKEGTVAEHALQKTNTKKESLVNALANELTMLREVTSASSAGKKAVQMLQKLGKDHCGSSSTLLQAFALACKKEASARSEFEMTTFTTLQAQIDKAIGNLAKEIEGQAATAQEKQVAVAAAKDALDKAKAAAEAASQELVAAQNASKEASKGAAKAAARCLAIWDDMKAACQAQDGFTGDLKNFSDNVWPAFEQLKNKEPEPEPVEPEPVVEEPVETSLEAPQ